MKIVTVKPGPVDTIGHLGTTAKRLLLLESCFHNRKLQSSKCSPCSSDRNSHTPLIITLKGRIKSETVKGEKRET